jgi:hypothetical protein
MVTDGTHHGLEPASVWVRLTRYEPSGKLRILVSVSAGSGPPLGRSVDRQKVPHGNFCRVVFAARHRCRYSAAGWPFSLLRSVRTLIPSSAAACVRLPPLTSSARAMSRASAAPTSSEVSTTAPGGTCCMAVSL